MLHLAPLALAVWRVEMGTAIVTVTVVTIGTGATTVIATGTGDTVTVGSEYCVEVTSLSSLLLTLYHFMAVNVVVRGHLTDAGTKSLLVPCPFRRFSGACYS